MAFPPMLAEVTLPRWGKSDTLLRAGLHRGRRGLQAERGSQSESSTAPRRTNPLLGRPAAGADNAAGRVLRGTEPWGGSGRAARGGKCPVGPACGSDCRWPPQIPSPCRGAGRPGRDAGLVKSRLRARLCQRGVVGGKHLLSTPRGWMLPAAAARPGPLASVSAKPRGSGAGPGAALGPGFLRRPPGWSDPYQAMSTPDRPACAGAAFGPLPCGLAPFRRRQRGGWGQHSSWAFLSAHKAAGR